MILESLFMLVVLGAGSPTAQQSDTLKVNGEVRERLDWHYDLNRRRSGRGWTGEEYGDYLGWKCSADSGEACYGRDWTDHEECPANVDCHPSPGALLDLLVESSRAHPESGFVTGQAVFALAKWGRHLEAFEIAQACEASEWWCEALLGHVYQAVGRVTEAEAHYRRFAESAPDSVICQSADASWLLGPWSIQGGDSPPPTWEADWSHRSCGARRAASDTIWWLSDPLFIVDGNDRWTEHIDRNLKGRFYSEIHRPGRPGSQRIRSWAIVARRGPWDSFELSRNPGAGFNGLWTSLVAARYHFVPDFEGEGFENPTWRLMGTVEDEGYTPPYGPFHELPVQIARFRTSAAEAEGSMRVATAGTVQGTPISDAAESAYLVLSDGPESFPLQLSAPFNEGRAVFLTETSNKRYVASFEVVTGAGIGWHRRMLEPLESVEGPGISDVLLFQPMGFTMPDSLLSAASMMLASTEFDADEATELGLYWEVYGAPEDAPVTFDLEVQREGGGFIEFLQRLLPGGSEGGSGRLTWSDRATGPRFSKAIILGMEGLEPGSYTLVLRASWDGREAVESRREFRVR